MKLEPPQHESKRSRSRFATIAIACSLFLIAVYPTINWGLGELVWWNASRGGAIVSPEDWPFELQDLVQELGREKITNIYAYDLGGFIDHQYLWKFTTNDPDSRNILKALKVHPLPGQKVPSLFFHMPPSWWSSKALPNAVFYASQGFDFNQRGDDGVYYCVMHDTAGDTFYIWQKWNF